MAQDKYPNKVTDVAGVVYGSAVHNADRDGVQSDFNTRLKSLQTTLAYEGGGALAVAIDAVNDKVDITIPSGSYLYHAGKRYTALTAWTFTTEATGDYKLYLDDSAEDTAKTTGAVPADDVQLATVHWDLPTLVLSALVDTIPNAGITNLADDSVKDSDVDWGTGAGQVSGVDMPIADAGGWFSTDNVEAALQEAGAAKAAPFVTTALDAALPNERVLTGTSNQVTVTDGGAGTTVTLSTPQDTHTAATPQFAGVGLGEALPASTLVGVKGAATYDLRVRNNAANTGYTILDANNSFFVGGNGDMVLVVDYNNDSTGAALWIVANGEAGTTLLRVFESGNVAIGTHSPTAVLHLKAGTATAGTAPIKLTAGVNLTTPEAGTVEFDGTHLYVTIVGTRYQLDQQVVAAVSSVSDTETIVGLAQGSHTDITVDHSGTTTFAEAFELQITSITTGACCYVLGARANGDKTGGGQFILRVENETLASGEDIVIAWTRKGII